MARSAKGSLRDALRVPSGEVDLATLLETVRELDPEFPRPDVDVPRLTKSLASPN